jgi:hypothetical protein
MAAVAAVLVVMAWTGEYVYPALAIALVPNLIAPIVVWQYSLAIGVGAAALFVGAFILACTGRFCARRFASASLAGGSGKVFAAPPSSSGM